MNTDLSDANGTLCNIYISNGAEQPSIIGMIYLYKFKY